MKTLSLKKIEMGKGKKCGCDISLYIQPFASTKEEFNKYSDREGKQHKQDQTSNQNY